jgi:hypothetical protein
MEECFMARSDKKIPERKYKNKMMNVKLPEDDYRELQKIADDLGGMSLSAMIRVLIYSKLEKVRKTGNTKYFLDVDKKDIDKK